MCKLDVFMQIYSLNEIEDIKVKYNTKAADYYRRMIEAKANQQEFAELQPSVSEGRCLTDGRRLDSDGNIVEDVVIADNEQDFEPIGNQEERKQADQNYNPMFDDSIDHQEVIMEKFKNGLGVMVGVVKTGAQAAALGAQTAYAAVEDEEARQQTSEIAAVKASEAVETAKDVSAKVGMTFYESGLATKQKFEEVGGAEMAKSTAI